MLVPFNAGTSFIKLVADPTNKLPQITYWLMGSLAGAKWSEIKFVIFPMLAGIIPLILLRWRLNVVTMGDEEARSMGVDAEKIRSYHNISYSCNCICGFCKWSNRLDWSCYTAYDEKNCWK